LTKIKLCIVKFPYILISFLESESLFFSEVGIFRTNKSSLKIEMRIINLFLHLILSYFFHFKKLLAEKNCLSLLLIDFYQNRI